MKTTTEQLIHPARQTAGEGVARQGIKTDGQPPSPPSGERAGVRGNKAFENADAASRSKEARKERGFNRLELMVVLAVLALLASLFLPALARESARDSRAFCLHRVGQLARAMAMYAAEAEDWLPPNPDDGNTVPYHNWCGGQAGVGGAEEFKPDILRDPTRALLTTYLGGNISYYRCPADLRTGKYQGTDPQRRGQIIPSARTMSLNHAVGTTPYVSGGKRPVDGPWLDGNHSHIANRTWYCYGRMSDFVRPGPARTFTFIEEDAYSLNDGTFCTTGPKTPPLYYMIDWPVTYHEVAGGVAFADGHAEMHRWVDKRTVLKAGASTMTQPNNPDLVWLTERASALVVKP